MNIEKLFKRLRREYIKINLIQSGLDSIIAFLAINIALFFTNIRIASNSLHFNIILGLTAIFFIINLIYRSKKYNIELYEEKNPEFKEILRTARDNMDSKNVVSQAMFEDLISRAKEVTSDSIIPGKEIVKKICIVGVLSFLTVLSGITNFQVQKDTQKVFSELNIKKIINEDEKTLKNNSEILGEEKDIQATSVDLKIKVQDSAETNNTNPLKVTEEKQLRYEKTRETLPEDIQLAKKYSKAIRDIK